EPGRRVDIGGPFSCSGVSAPAIISLSNGAMRMYYRCSPATSSSFIVSTTSLDGLLWTPEPGSRVIPPAYSQLDYREMAVQDLPGSIKRMYFGQYDNVAQTGEIVSAISSDGLAWGIEPAARVEHGASGAPDGRASLTPNIVDLGDGTFRIYY